MDNKPVVPKKVMPEKIYLRCSQGGFWFSTRNHEADTEYVLASEFNKIKDELDKYKSKSLLFNSLQHLGFNIIVSEEVPQNQIWFATHGQLQKALDYSKEQIEQELKKKVQNDKSK